MRLLRGQVDLWHVLGPLLTAGVIGLVTVVWGFIRPEPKVDQEKAVAAALQAREVAELRRTVDIHTIALEKALPQLKRIEETVNDLREARGGIRPAGGKR